MEERWGKYRVTVFELFKKYFHWTESWWRFLIFSFIGKYRYFLKCIAFYLLFLCGFLKTCVHVCVNTYVCAHVCACAYICHCRSVEVRGHSAEVSSPPSAYRNSELKPGYQAWQQDPNSLKHLSGPHVRSLKMVLDLFSRLNLAFLKVAKEIDMDYK